MNYYVIIVATLFFGITASLKPYHGYPQPNWTLIGGEQPADKSFEFRRYSPAKWISTNVTGVDFDEVGSVAFWRLHGYISGGNVQELKIPMTVPVITTFRNRPCPFCNISFTMSFYIPPSVSSDPPLPTDDRLFLVEVPETDVYVRRFSGYAMAKDWVRETAALSESLISHNVFNYDKTTFIAAGYDSPFWFLYRRNEVWLIAN